MQNGGYFFGLVKFGVLEISDIIFLLGPSLRMKKK